MTSDPQKKRATNQDSVDGEQKPIADFFRGHYLSLFGRMAAARKKQHRPKYIFGDCSEHVCACMCMSAQAVIVILMDAHFDLLIVSIWKRNKKYIYMYLHLLIAMCEAINKFCGRAGSFFYTRGRRYSKVLQNNHWMLVKV